jgi:hypothetical protein
MVHKSGRRGNGLHSRLVGIGDGVTGVYGEGFESHGCFFSNLLFIKIKACEINRRLSNDFLNGIPT